MIYRPTVRYDLKFKEYVDDLFYSTHLDRNQIIRAALFSAAHSAEFKNLLKNYKKHDSALPPCPWDASDNGLWLEATRNKEGREGRYDDTSRTRAIEKDFDGVESRSGNIERERIGGTNEGRKGEISKRGNGITIRL